MNATESKLELELHNLTISQYRLQLQQIMLWIRLPSSATPAEDKLK
jgi:hypothetical protein